MDYAEVAVHLLFTVCYQKQWSKEIYKTDFPKCWTIPLKIINTDF